ncbi:MAG: dihydropteroate synthase [Alphaproteobacteria bacterium]|nr:dihydropteroate synthase [Alphaproteobacteria bacterium]
MRLSDRFAWGTRCYVMGILNVTPDSFSGDGLMRSGDPVSRAVEQARAFCAAGADILDVGGESTRPGSDPISAQEEIDRVVPVIEAVTRAVPDTVISIDTSKAPVAAAALAAGAAIVNDIWALQADPALAGLVAQRRAPVILMHNRSRPKDVAHDSRLGGRYLGATYAHLMDEVTETLGKLADAAIGNGIDHSQIVLDPGIGFGKTVIQNLALLNHLDRVKALGFPVLVGASRKSFIGQVLDVPPDEREEGTAATTAVGVMRGADIVRVHDVRTAARIVRMVEAVLRAPADGASTGGTRDEGAA